MARPKGSKSSVPAGETSEQKFMRLGQQRMRNTLRGLNSIGKLAAYKGTAKQHSAILVALNEAVRAIQTQFEGRKVESGFRFEE